MDAATWVTVILCAITLIGLIITCIIDPAGLVDAKYGKREES